MTFRQVGRFRRPVVHLRVDIDGVLTLPGRRHQMVPYSLQVGGLGTITRRRNQQVTTVLEIERGQMRIKTLQKRGRPLVSWQISERCSSQVEFDALKKSLMFAHVQRTQCRERLAAGLLQLTRRYCLRISTYVFIASVTGCGDDQKQC